MGNQIQTSVTIINSLLGFQALSYTAHNTSAACAIAAGSKVEIAGAFFNFPIDETVNSTSWNSITTATTAFIALTPSGTAGSQTVSVSYVSTTPVWSTSKQGWYLSAGSNVRIVGSCYKTSSTQFDVKMFLGNAENIFYNYRMRGETDLISTVGTSTYTVKDGVYRLGVIVVGGGGGGGGGASAGGNGGGGGGGGTIICDALIQYMDVIPGQSISYTVGAGGSAGAPDNAGGAGASSLFSVIAGKGGVGGKQGAGPGYGYGGYGPPNTLSGMAGSSGDISAGIGGCGGGAGGLGAHALDIATAGNKGGGGGGGKAGGGAGGYGASGGNGIIIIKF